MILRVLSMYQDPEQREQEIKNISSVYKTLADEILPQLRRSRLTLNYEIIGKSDEEIANLADSDAKQLNIEELLYATTLTKDAAKQEAIFTKATQIYPNDFRAYNNLGKLAYQAGDLNKAESYFKKALSIKDAPEANMNLGLIALTKGDRTAAESYLSKASGSKELNEAWVICMLLKDSTTRLSAHLATLRLTALLWHKSWLRTTTRLRTHWLLSKDQTLILTT